jgi:hypothetical protein
MIIKVTAIRPAESPHAFNVDPFRVQVASRPGRVLDFDIENRPLTYLGSDFTTAEVTAVAWAWTDKPSDVTVCLLGPLAYGGSPLEMILRTFRDVYDKADMVTGHYIKGHDLPMMNGALMEHGMPLLGDMLVQDTKIDLIRSKGLSLSQESLAAMFRLEHQKQSMNQGQWRAANRLTPEGLAEVRRRVVGDVRQHIELRQRLLDLGYLKAPKIWKSNSAMPAYTP